MATIPITRPELGADAEAAVQRVVRSGWVMQGPEVAAFERELAAALGAVDVVAVANGTVALELALRAVGVGGGDEVITVSHSFIATANAVVAVGATPVFVDIDAATFGMDARAIAAAVSPRTRAILCVHQIGVPCDLPAILAEGARLGVPVVEDAACALGSELRLGDTWQHIGAPHGALATFSFHPRKIVTTGDGGAIAVRDADTAGRLRGWRNHGMIPAGWQQAPAWNARLTDLQAALGRTQLARLGAILGERRRLAAALDEALSQSTSLAPPAWPAWGRTNWQSYPARVRGGGAAEVARVRAALQSRGVETRPGITCAHRLPPYAGTTRARTSPGGLAVSERLEDETLLLPLFHGMRDDELTTLVAALRAV